MYTSQAYVMIVIGLLGTLQSSHQCTLQLMCWGDMHTPLLVPQTASKRTSFVCVSVPVAYTMQACITWYCILHGMVCTSVHVAMCFKHASNTAKHKLVRVEDHDCMHPVHERITHARSCETCIRLSTVEGLLSDHHV